MSSENAGKKPTGETKSATEAVDYRLLAKQAESLVRDVPHLVANLANLSALLYDSLPDISWVGFYRLEGDSLLILGPFQGKVACVTLPPGKGVCGAAVRSDKTVVVADVCQFEGHIACDSASRSEIVLPIHKEGKIWGVLDIDSPITDRFSPSDRKGLEELVAALERSLF